MANDSIAGDNRITIDIYDRSLNLVGPGPIISCLGFDCDTLLSQAGSFSARFPANDPILSYIRLKAHFLFVYYDDDLIFHAFPESSGEEVSDDGQRMLVLSGRDMLGELDETSVDFTAFNLGSDAISNAPTLAAIAYNTFNVGKEWVIDPGLTETPVYVTAAGESALAVFTRIADYINESFRVSGARGLTWLGTSTPDSGVRAIQGAGDAVDAESNPFVCFIQKLTQRQAAQSMMTDIVPYGSGFGDTRLDLAGTTRADILDGGGNALYTRNTADNSIRSWAAYDYIGKVIRRHVMFKDIRPLANTDADLLTAKNYLFDTAIAYIKRNDSIDDSLEYDLEVVQLPAFVQVGMTLRVVYQDAGLEIDRDLVILGIRRSVGSDGALAVTLTVSTINSWKLRESSTLVASVDAGEILAGHPQIDANVYWENFREIIGDDQIDHMAEMPFFLATEVVTIRQVLFRCKVERMLTAGKTYSLGGNTSLNVAANTGNTDTTASGGTNTPDTAASSATTTANGVPNTSGASSAASSGASAPGSTDPTAATVTATGATSLVGTAVTVSLTGGTNLGSTATTTSTQNTDITSLNAGGIDLATQGTSVPVVPSTHSHAMSGHAHFYDHTHSTTAHSHTIATEHGHSSPSHTHTIASEHGHTSPIHSHTHTVTHTHTIAHTHDTTHAHNMAHIHAIPHTHNIPHTHPSPQHTHPLPALTESFGVTRVAALNSYVISDLEYSVNGGAWLGLDTAIPVDGGYYEADVTSVIQNPSGLRRPIQEYNLIQIRRKTAAGVGKSAMVRVKIGIRSTIQSVVLYA